MVRAKKPAPLTVLALATAVIFYLLSFDAVRAAGLSPVLCLSILTSALATSLFFAPLSAMAGKRSLRLASLWLWILSLSCATAALQSLASHTIISPGQDLRSISRIEGSLTGDPRLIEGGILMARLKLERSFSEGLSETSSRGVVTVFLEADESYQSIPFEDLPAGSRLRLRGRFREGRRGLSFSASDFTVLYGPSGLMGQRTYLRSSLIRRLQGEPWGGMALALILGWRDGLDSGEEGVFRSAGCSHILALSGMHMAVLSSLILLFLKKPLGLVPSALVSLVLLSFFLWLAGLQSSLLRAFIMYSLTLLCAVKGLSGGSGTIISASFLIQLLIEPSLATSPAFVLSYLALAGILLLAEPVCELLPAILPPLIRKAVGASVGAFLLSLPAQALFFGESRPIGILLSTVLGPLAALLMTSAIAYLFIHSLWPPIALPAELLCRLSSSLLLKIAGFGSKAPALKTVSVLSTLIFTIIVVSGILFLYRLLSIYRRERVPFA